MLIKTNADALSAIAAMQAGVCFACGSNTETLSSIGSEGSAQNMGQFLACVNCILKYSRTQLAAEADRVLAVMSSPYWKRRASAIPDRITCRKCRKDIDKTDSRIAALLAENRIPLICFECFDDLRALQESVA